MKFTAGLVMATFCLFPLPNAADVLLLDVISQEPPNSPAGLLRPSRGMSMDRVRERFGEPERQEGPVGEPPISRWVYPDYNVYFERNLVLTSVLNR
jgi:hypothetical protein